MDTAILGVGNILMKDDGVGVHVARALSGLDLPDGVVVIDAGTDPDVAYDVDWAARVIVVDAMRGDGPPGTMYRLTGADAATSQERSCHDITLLETLCLARPAVRDLVVFGIEPKEIGCGLDLSPEVAETVPRVIERVREELEARL